VSQPDGPDSEPALSELLLDVGDTGTMTASRLADHLASLIRDGRLQAGHLLPTSIELENLAGIPRGTFVRARRLLLAAALVRRVPEGWEVAEIQQR
jgi:DNA-binding GntR family transcriptional regulator